MKSTPTVKKMSRLEKVPRLGNVAGTVAAVSLQPSEWKLSWLTNFAVQVGADSSLTQLKLKSYSWLTERLKKLEVQVLAQR